MEQKLTHTPDQLARAMKVLAGEDDPGPAPDLREELNDAMSRPETEQETATETAEQAAEPETAGTLDEEKADNDDQAGENQSDETAATDGEEIELTVRGVAQGLGLDETDVYGMSVPMPEGHEAVTVSELKDAYMSVEKLNDARGEVETSRRQLEEARDEHERITMQDRQEIRLLLDVVKAESIPPQVLEQLTARERRRRERNREDLLSTFPEFREKAKYDAFATKAGAFLADRYAYRPSEIAAIDDPRTFRMVRDHMQLVDRLEQAEKALEAARKGERAETTPSNRRVARKRAPNGKFKPRTPVEKEKQISAQVHDLINRSQ